MQRTEDISIEGMIDYTCLSPVGDAGAVRKLCREAKKAGYASVCVNPAEVPLAAKLLKGSDVKVCTVIGFPLGQDSTLVKCFAATDAVNRGADELDFVINRRLLKYDPDACLVELRNIVETCRRMPEIVARPAPLVKLILECCDLTRAEIALGCRLAKRAGFDFVKTSTGFGKGGATVEDVKLMRRTVGRKMGVKAAGGIRTRETALAMIAAGATRIGTSAAIRGLFAAVALAGAALLPRTLCAAYPDLLTFADGTAVKDASDWERRRTEVAATILPVVYGAFPAAPAKPVEVELVSQNHYPFKFKDTTPNSWFQIYRVTTEYEGRPFVFNFSRWCPGGDEAKRPTLIEGDGCWQYLTDDVLRFALKRGWAVAQFNRCEVTPDDARTDGCALVKWAWMYHRVVDALLKDPRTDPARLAIAGHSRGGKTVLLAAATDPRVSCVNDNCSGCCGSSPSRDVPQGGERIADIVRQFPYWFAPGWKEWAGREEELPFDQHFLTALIAPRGLFIREAEKDFWANPPGAKALVELARPVWRLYGREDALCYSLRDGYHCHRGDDFEDYLSFCEEYWSAGSVNPSGK